MIKIPCEYSEMKTKLLERYVEELEEIDKERKKQILLLLLLLEEVIDD